MWAQMGLFLGDFDKNFDKKSVGTIWITEPSESGLFDLISFSTYITIFIILQGSTNSI